MFAAEAVARILTLIPRRRNEFFGGLFPQALIICHAWALGGHAPGEHPPRGEKREGLAQPQFQQVSVSQPLHVCECADDSIEGTRYMSHFSCSLGMGYQKLTRV